MTAAPGVGKSAWLVHVGLDALLAGRAVLHVSLRDSVDRVRIAYDELLAALSPGDRSPAGVERNRMIHAYRDRAFEVAHLAANLDMLAHVAGFRPALLLVDALGAGASAEVAALAELGRARGMLVWIAAAGRVEGVTRWVTLEAAGVHLVATADGGSGVVLDSERLLPVGDVAEPSASDPAGVTLYSGGANGTEERFGVEAERWGLAEVGFSFEGHRQARTRGRVELSARELQAGDAGLAEVSSRLERDYAEGSLLRKVMQTLWHVVSRAEQVFVVGVIQDDLTVRGGTGWAVELARSWDKELWVFDQDRRGWYRWDGADFAPGEPRITARSIAGTGTRYPTDAGRQAIEDLFERSFGG